MVQQVTDHYLAAISALDRAPAVIGHSFGGLIAQKIAGEGAAAVTVSIDNAPFKGVLPLPVSAPWRPAPYRPTRATAAGGVATLEQYKFGWANNLSDAEAEQLWTDTHVAASGAPLFQAAFANFNPFGGETKVDRRTRTVGRC